MLRSISLLIRPLIKVKADNLHLAIRLILNLKLYVDNLTTNVSFEYPKSI